MTVSGVRTKAIVLRRTNYGEADRIIQLLTPEGRRSVLARGVRREKSKLAGGIELFALSDVVLVKSRGDLGILSSARLVRFFRYILEDYDRLQFGYEVLKQVSKASDTVDEPEWYDLALETLEALDNKIALELIQTWFYLRHAALLGHELSFSHDVNGRKLEPGVRYDYDVDEKGLKQSERGELTTDHIKFLRLMGAKPLKIVAQVGGVETILPECVLLARRQAAL